LIPIIEHNRNDVISLASFLMKIYEESFSNWFFKQFLYTIIWFCI
jgi:uncharacterized protein YprB with RNaseH-like and TPR domain